jgi:hypothetical protein
MTSKGVVLFKPDTGGSLDPVAWKGTFLSAADIGLKNYFGYPWGKQDMITSGDPQGNDLATCTRLKDLDPTLTIAFFKLSGLLPDDDPTTVGIDEPAIEYMTNRSTEKPWNDAWGQPLIIAFGLYQPPTGALCGKALRQYQYNRSVYIAVAAVGPLARVPDADLKSSDPTQWGNSPTKPTDGYLDKLWSQANWVCQQAKENPFDKDWSELSFDNPMWQGNKVDYLNPTKRDKDANKSETGYNTYTGKEEHQTYLT